MNFECSAGCSVPGTKTNPPPRVCGPHKLPLIYEKALGRSSSPAKPKPRKPLKRTGRRETPAEKKARERFNEVVLSWPCWSRKSRKRQKRSAGATNTEFNNEAVERHICRGPGDAHHLVEKQWIRRTFSDLPEAELLAILFDPRIGAPLCRAAHDNIKTERIYFDELTPECVDFCREVDERYRDLGSGRRRPSMLTRLKLECPERASTHQEAALTGSTERSRNGR